MKNPGQVYVPLLGLFPIIFSSLISCITLHCSSFLILANSPVCRSTSDLHNTLRYLQINQERCTFCPRLDRQGHKWGCRVHCPCCDTFLLVLGIDNSFFSGKKLGHRTRHSRHLVCLKQCLEPASKRHKTTIRLFLLYSELLLHLQLINR